MAKGWFWHPENTVDAAGKPVIVLCFDDETPPPMNEDVTVVRFGADARAGERPLRSLLSVFGDRELVALEPGTAIVNTLKSATVAGILGARRLGVRRFYLIDSPGSWIRSNTRGAVALTADRLVRRTLARLPVVPTLIERAFNSRLNPPWPTSEASERAVEAVVARTTQLTPRPMQTPCRVMHLIGSLGPGGAERQLSYLARATQAAGHDVSILVTALAGSGSHYLPELEGLGIPVSELEQYGYHHLLPDLRALSPYDERSLLESHCSRGLVFALIETLRDRRPDVLHCWLDQTNTAGALAGLVAGVPRILVSCRALNPSQFAHIYRPWLRGNYRALARSPRVRFLANSEAAAESYAEWAGIPRERFTVVRNGFPLERWPAPSPSDRSAARRGFGIDEDAFVIAGVLRMSEEKRPLDFVRAVAKLRERLPSVRALHAGTGTQRDAVHAEAKRLGLEGTLTFLGQTSDLAPLRAACDVGVLCSRIESCPNVLLEFQAAERPVVYTASGGSPETVKEGETGLGVAVGDVDAMAEHLLALAQDPERAQAMGKAGRAWVAERFSIERMVSETLELYTN